MNAYSFNLSIRIMKVKLAILFLSVPGLVLGQEETVLPVASVEGQPQEVFASPVVLGLKHDRHGLPEVQEGRLLVGELMCMACHLGADTVKKVGPNLFGRGLAGGSVVYKRVHSKSHGHGSGDANAEFIGGFAQGKAR